MTWSGENTPTRFEEALYGSDSSIDKFTPALEPEQPDDPLASISDHDLLMIINQAAEAGDDETAAACAAEFEARQSFQK